MRNQVRGRFRPRRACREPVQSTLAEARPGSGLRLATDECDGLGLPEIGLRVAGARAVAPTHGRTTSGSRQWNPPSDFEMFGSSLQRRAGRRIHPIFSTTHRPDPKRRCAIRCAWPWGRFRWRWERHRPSTKESCKEPSRGSRCAWRPCSPRSRALSYFRSCCDIRLRKRAFAGSVPDPHRSSVQSVLIEAIDCLVQAQPCLVKANFDHPEWTVGEFSDLFVAEVGHVLE